MSINSNPTMTTKNFIPEIKQVKMNFKINEPTLNNHIYSREILEDALNKVLREKPFLPITRNCDELIDEQYRPKEPFITEIIGRFKGFTITDNGEIILDIKPTIDTELFDNFKITPAIIGKTGSDDETIIEIHDVIGFFIAHGKDKVIEVKR